MNPTFIPYHNHIVRILIGKERFQALGQAVPHRPYLDLYQVYAYPEERHYRIISQQELCSWQTDPDTLDRLAARNSPKDLGCVFVPMEHYLKEFFDLPFTDQEPLLYILTNSFQSYGASSILYPGILPRLFDRLQDDFYLLPASLHEFLLIREQEDFTPASLASILRQINHTAVSAEDFLSDSLYFYSHDSGEIYRCDV